MNSSMNLRTAGPIVALVLLSVFATAFSLINYSNSVKVWPLVSFQPLTLVISIAFLLGAGVGGLLVHLLHHTRRRAAGPIPLDTAPVVNAQDRKPAVRL